MSDIPILADDLQKYPLVYNAQTYVPGINQPGKYSAEYFTLEYAQTQIAEFLEIPDASMISILDARPETGLYLITYSDKADVNVYGYLRGLVIDIYAKTYV